MSEFIVKIEDEIVQIIGKDNIEQYLQEFITQTILKATANDILSDYGKGEISDDESWLNAKKKVFLNDRYSQYIKVYANV
jgi:bifunctional ADP-heptose synthase (sugar kinase/adenylyltransferase)